MPQAASDGRFSGGTVKTLVTHAGKWPKTAPLLQWNTVSIKPIWLPDFALITGQKSLV